MTNLSWENSIFPYIFWPPTKTMHYLPSFRVFFESGVYNDYRLREGRVEFSPNEGEWRILDDSDVQLHFRFNTPVSKWLKKQSMENKSGSRASLAPKTR